MATCLHGNGWNGVGPNPCPMCVAGIVTTCPGMHDAREVATDNFEPCKVCRRDIRIAELEAAIDALGEDKIGKLAYLLVKDKNAMYERARKAEIQLEKVDAALKKWTPHFPGDSSVAWDFAEDVRRAIT